MKNAHLNPAIVRYADLLLPNGRYPAVHTEILWNLDRFGKVRDVEVTFLPRKVGWDAEFADEVLHFTKNWSSSLGNSINDWLDKRGHTPETVFGFLLRLEFASQEELKSALREFGWIAECEWARKMLAGGF